MSTSKVKDQV